MGSQRRATASSCCGGHDVRSAGAGPGRGPRRRSWRPRRAVGRAASRPARRSRRRRSRPAGENSTRSCAADRHCADDVRAIEYDVHRRAVAGHELLERVEQPLSLDGQRFVRPSQLGRRCTRRRRAGRRAGARGAGRPRSCRRTSPPGSRKGMRRRGRRRRPPGRQGPADRRRGATAGQHSSSVRSGPTADAAAASASPRRWVAAAASLRAATSEPSSPPTGPPAVNRGGRHASRRPVDRSGSGGLGERPRSPHRRRHLGGPVPAPPRPRGPGPRPRPAERRRRPSGPQLTGPLGRRRRRERPPPPARLGRAHLCAGPRPARSRVEHLPLEAGSAGASSSIRRSCSPAARHEPRRAHRVTRGAWRPRRPRARRLAARSWRSRRRPNRRPPRRRRDRRPRRPSPRVGASHSQPSRPTRSSVTPAATRSRNSSSPSTARRTGPSAAPGSFWNRRYGLSAGGLAAGGLSRAPATATAKANSIAARRDSSGTAAPLSGRPRRRARPAPPPHPAGPHQRHVTASTVSLEHLSSSTVELAAGRVVVKRPGAAGGRRRRTG